MASTYTPIATTTLGSAASSVTFSSIASTYTDLILVMSYANTTATADVRLQFNGDTGTNYSYSQVYGTGSAVGSNRDSNSIACIAGYTGTTQSNSVVHINNYSNATTYKSTIARWNDPSALVVATVSTWRSTSAINQIVISYSANNFSTGSTFTLYGIQAA